MLVKLQAFRASHFKVLQAWGLLHLGIFKKDYSDAGRAEVQGCVAVVRWR